MSKHHLLNQQSIILGFDSNKIRGLTSLENYKSILNIAEENNKFEYCTDTFDEFFFAELKDELEEILQISKITPEHKQDKKRPRIIRAVEKLETKKDGLMVTLF